MFSFIILKIFFQRMTNEYLNLIRYMSGQSRKDMKSGRSFERTHLIESKTDSDNYNVNIV